METRSAINSKQPLRIAAATCSLMLGGSTTFLINLHRALSSGPHRLRVVGLVDESDHSADFRALNMDVRTGWLKSMIYEDRLAWAYREIADFQPQALLACLGSESYEMLRLAPVGVARIGLIQADDSLP